MATHVGTSGVVKVGANTVAEVTGFTLNETQDTVEDTSLTDSKKSYIALCLCCLSATFSKCNGLKYPSSECKKLRP